MRPIAIAAVVLLGAGGLPAFAQAADGIFSDEFCPTLNKMISAARIENQDARIYLYLPRSYFSNGDAAGPSPPGFPDKCFLREMGGNNPDSLECEIRSVRKPFAPAVDKQLDDVFTASLQKVEACLSPAGWRSERQEHGNSNFKSNTVIFTRGSGLTAVEVERSVTEFSSSVTIYVSEFQRAWGNEPHPYIPTVSG